MSAAPARKPLTRRALVAAVTALVAALCMLCMDTAYAMWQEQVSTDAGTVTTATAELTAQWSGDDDPSTWQNLVPGDAVPRTIIVTNSGDVPLALDAAVLASPAGIELRMGDDASKTSTGTALSPAPQPLSESGAPLVLEPGETTSIQVMLTATPALAPAPESEVAVEFEGRQVA